MNNGWQTPTLKVANFLLMRYNQSRISALPLPHQNVDFLLFQWGLPISPGNEGL